MDSMSDFKSDDDDDDDDLNDSKKFSDNEMKLHPVLKKSKKVETKANNFFIKIDFIWVLQEKTSHKWYTLFFITVNPCSIYHGLLKVCLLVISDSAFIKNTIGFLRIILKLHHGFLRDKR